MKWFLYFFMSLIYIVANAQMDEVEIAKWESQRFSHSLETKNNKSLIGSNIDVKHYELKINSDPYQNNFSGTTKINFDAINSLSSVSLHAGSNLQITDVFFEGVSILSSSIHSLGVLYINLPSMLNANSNHDITIVYSGMATSNGYSIDFHDTAPIASTLSEPFYARNWFVCKDDLSDKADNGCDVYITHPASHKAASNGVLIEVNNLINGKKRTHWKHQYQIVPYLIAISVTNYVEYNGNVTLGEQNIPIVNYIYPESNTVDNQQLIDDTADYMQFMYDTFGEYPYSNEKYGHAQWEWGGGMEHATMSFMLHFNRNLVVHELAHQWFGDKITCGTWQDIWLNEGFATYCSALIIEHQDPIQNFTNWKEDALNYICSSFAGSVYINSEAEAQNVSRIFSYRLSYIKAAMVLHMLRFKMGDDAFFSAINNYLNDPNLAYGFAITPQFQAHLESTYGSDLDEFFNDWIYGEGFPIFDVHLSSYNDNYTLQVSQSSSHPSVAFFETPFEVTFYGNSGQSVTKKYNMNYNNQSFTVEDIDFDIVSYSFNSHFDVVCKVNSETLSVEDVSGNNVDNQLFPNPTHDYLYFSQNSLIKNIKVYDSTGKLILQQKELLPSELLNVEHLPKGTYRIEFEDEKGVLNKSFIKK